MSLPADLIRLRRAVLRGDPLAVAAMEAWQRWQDTPREQVNARRHQRRAWERAAARALREVKDDAKRTKKKRNERRPR